MIKTYGDEIRNILPHISMWGNYAKVQNEMINKLILFFERFFNISGKEVL
jgi:hypothetical protein